MTEAERGAMFDRHQGLVHKLAKRFAVTYHKDTEEMISEGQLGLAWFVSHYDEYDNKKGKESTWAYQCIYWGLMTACTKKHPSPISLNSLGHEDEPYEPPMKTNWVDNLLREIGVEGSFLIRTIVNAPAEIIEEMDPRMCAKARKTVKEYLIDELDWSKHKLNKAWKEVEECLSAPA